MANNLATFATLTDSANGTAYALEKRVEGDASAAQNGSIGFAFKDASGNLVLPALNALGQIEVDVDAGVNKSARGSTAAGSATMVTLTGGTITLLTSTVYRGLAGTVMCRRSAYFTIVWNDDGAETVLVDAILDSGQYSFAFDLKDHEFTSGATGTQQILIKAQNLGTGSSALSQLSGTVCTKEIA